MKQHLIIIISNDKKLIKKYTWKLETKTKEEAIKTAKKTFETLNNNYNYEAFYFENTF